MSEAQWRAGRPDRPGRWCWRVDEVRDKVHMVTVTLDKRQGIVLKCSTMDVKKLWGGQWKPHRVEPEPLSALDRILQG